MVAPVTMRKASAADLPAVNEVISAAIMTWDLPERVKRLSLPSYHYGQQDLETLELIVAENDNRHVAGLAAWEQADPRDTPRKQRALLLHGVYVHPEHQNQGIGRQLLLAAAKAASDQGYSDLLVKAQASAAGFFLACGMRPLPIENEQRDYAYRYWKPVAN